MKRSWLIFYHSICANDFSCINARGCGAPPQTETEQKDIFELLHRRRKNHLLSSVLNIYSKNGTISLAEKQVLWRMQSLTALSMIAIRLT